jgi:Peptidase propeptide and YPEB domain
MAAGAKVSIRQARATALKAVPGAITADELEKKGGGTGLRYSFDIRRGTKTFEVGIDARTGAVLENNVERPHPDEQVTTAAATGGGLRRLLSLGEYLGHFLPQSSSSCRTYMAHRNLPSALLPRPRPWLDNSLSVLQS